MDTAPISAGFVSHYRLLSRIGAGGMGEVWLAEDTQLPRKVAVKLLPRAAAGDPGAVARLLREAKAAATVDHPAVVTVYEAGVASGAPYLVMQHVEGETLSERLARGRRTPGYFASWAPQDPDFASLREHPEFIRLFSSAG